MNKSLPGCLPGLLRNGTEAPTYLCKNGACALRESVQASCWAVYPRGCCGSQEVGLLDHWAPGCCRRSEVWGMGSWDQRACKSVSGLETDRNVPHRGKCSANVPTLEVFPARSNQREESFPQKRQHWKYPWWGSGEGQGPAGRGWGQTARCWKAGKPRKSCHQGSVSYSRCVRGMETLAAVEKNRWENLGIKICRKPGRKSWEKETKSPFSILPARAAPRREEPGTRLCAWIHHCSGLRSWAFPSLLWLWAGFEHPVMKFI